MTHLHHLFCLKLANEEESYDYVVELLEQYRTDSWPKRKKNTYPFDEQALRFIMTSVLKTRTPRDINQYCSDAVTEAFRKRVFANPENFIDKQFIVEWQNSKNALELG